MRPGRLLLLGLLCAGGAAGAGHWGRGAAPDAQLPPSLSSLLERVVAERQAELEGALELWQDHSTWETRRRVRSAHYEVHTTQSYAWGMLLAESLESMLPKYTELTDLRLSSAGAPLPVFVFPDLAGYNTLGDQFAEHSSFYGSFYTDGNQEEVVATYYQDNLVLMQMWATHSAVHQFLDRAASGVQVPLWIDEGLASYFALFWSYDWAVDEFERMRTRDQLIPVSELVSADLTGYTERSHERLIQLGLLFTYLRVVHPDTRTVVEDGSVVSQPFVDYLRTRLAGNANPNHPVRRLLFDDAEELGQAFHGFTNWR